MRVRSAGGWFAFLVAVALPATASDHAQQLAQAQAAVVGLKVVALADARSNATLGRERSGSGVVLDADGLVLTIGYLVIEADEVDLLLPGLRNVPARVVASDPASGFGLVQALSALRIAPAPLGQAARVAPEEALLFVSGGDEGDLSLARMVARRAFSGSWEYHIEDALFVAPARVDHSGAGLFNARGELVGIGSLAVSDALGPGQPRVPGNMFVPVDLLRPILAELRRDGSSRQSHRPWLGVHCVEQAGELRVIRVNPDSPAEAAGLRPGDRILRIDGAEVRALQPFYAALWRDGTAQRELTLDIRRGDETSSLKLRSTDRMQTLRQANGV
jgi:serine protease Do